MTYLQKYCVKGEKKKSLFVISFVSNTISQFSVICSKKIIIKERNPN